jgi:large subunit ribosomal protein L19
MTTLINEIVKDQLKSVPQIKAGMHVRVHEKVKEKDRERIQVFEGIVLAKKHGKGINATFTVRKIVDGIGVEKTWPLHSPNIEKIEIIKTPKTRRAKLYYLRNLSVKKTKKKLKKVAAFKEIIKEEPTSEKIAEQENNNQKQENQETQE